MKNLVRINKNISPNKEKISPPRNQPPGYIHPPKEIKMKIKMINEIGFEKIRNLFQRFPAATQSSGMNIPNAMNHPTVISLPA
jgi:hypothetical protein